MFKELIEIIIKLFSKKELEPELMEIPEEVPPEPVVVRAKNIALIVGHTPNSKGAVAYTGDTEFDWNNSVAKKVKAITDYGKNSVKIFYRPEGSYKVAMKKLAEDVKAWGADLSLELHFNSFEKTAYGCEILTLDRDSTIEIADIWTDKLAKYFNLKERNRHGDTDGVKVIKSGGRGFYNLHYLDKLGIKNSLLIEPMFANKKTEESMSFFEVGGRDRYIRFLADRIDEL